MTDETAPQRTAPAGYTTLDALEETARRTGSAADWRTYCKGLALQHERGRALSVLRRITPAAPDEEPGAAHGPEPEQHAIEEAECLLLARSIARELGLLAYADFLMHRLSRSSSKAIARIAQGHLSESAQRRTAERENLRLRELQYAYLREYLLAEPHADAERYLRLARLTLHVGERDRLGSRLAAAADMLRQGLDLDPGHRQLLENQAQVLAALGDTEQLDAVLARLEERHPTSEVLRAVSRGTLQVGSGSLNDEETQVAMFLSSLTGSSDTDESAAALTDLRAKVDGWPTAALLRVLLAWGLIWAGQPTEALQQVVLLAEVAGPAHVDHFNLAHLFKALGDARSAGKHAALAHRFAGSEEEARDADEILASLGGAP